jgi:hypothetical protein
LRRGTSGVSSGRGHALYIAILFSLGLVIVGSSAIYGAGYYLTPLSERPFHPQYDLLKPTGLVGQGYGVVGSFMILSGVGIYSARKRLRILSTLGKLKYFLEFHIFLCTTGPALVLFHTTFKFGGLVAVSFWSMVAVVLSGLVGRYLYVQIPRGIQGNELSMAELNARHALLGERLTQVHGVPRELLTRIDGLARPPRPAAELSTWQTLRFLLLSDLQRGRKLRALVRGVRARNAEHAAVREFLSLVSERLVLTRRIALLARLRSLFTLWHVIHLPFSIIMLIIFLVHVGVAIAFGYRWIF